MKIYTYRHGGFHFNINLSIIFIYINVHKGLHDCFQNDYEHLFDVPQHSRTDNDVSGLAPKYLHSGRRLIMRWGRIVAGGYFLSTVESNV